VARNDLTEAQYRATFDDLFSKQGFRIVDVCGYQSGGEARFGAIWEKAIGSVQGRQRSNHMTALASFQAEFDQNKNDGFRPTRVCGYNVAGQTYFASIFENSPGPEWFADHTIKPGDLRAVFDGQDQDGKRLVDVSAYVGVYRPGTSIPDEIHFACVWEKADGRHWGWIPTRDGNEYQKAFDTLNKQGYFPVRVAGYQAVNRGQPQFTAVMEQTGGRDLQARNGIDSAGHQKTFDDLTAKGYRMISVGGFTADVGTGANAVPAFCPVYERRVAAPVIAHHVEAVMQNCDIPGLSLAVAKDGRLVHAAGYGAADKATGDKVTPASLFRIASLSKQITSVAVMRLIEDGRLQLSDTVFGKGGVLEPMFGTDRTFGTNITKITLQHLLEHTSGGWPTANGNQDDPMFYADPTRSQKDLISDELGKDVTEPGTVYAYSNFGYCVLGRVIEQVSGQPYAAFVSDRVLSPCGISDMRIAGNTVAERRPGEVTYYDGGLAARGITDPYKVPVARMDAHGGWLATPTDLLRLLVRVDGFATVPDLLRADTITTMTTPSAASGTARYAKGWTVTEDGTWLHNGNLPGSESWQMRTADGYCFVVLTNTARRTPAYKDTTSSTMDLLWRIRTDVDFWDPGQPL
jgi:CubicO group peptidase (beta-lactamase class C family)